MLCSVLLSDLSLQWISLSALAAIGYIELPWYGNLLIATWLWCLGANVGSFMNVVVFRVPEGRSVVTPRSRCPSCDSAIAWYDNIPVISWMILRAKCRRCGLPISSRYPTIEAIMALLFVLVAFLSPITSAANLPETRIVPPLRFNTAMSLWLMYGLHMLLLSTLACAALIRYDGKRPPLRLFTPLLLVATVAAMIWPQLRPVPFLAPVHIGKYWTAGLDSLVGISVGAVLALIGWACWRCRNETRGQAASWIGEEILAGASVGVVLGWQAAAFLIPSAAVMQLLTLRLSHWKSRFSRWAWTGHLWWMAAVYIVLWRQIVDTVPGLGSRATIVTLAVSTVAMTLLSWLAVAIARSPQDDRPTNSLSTRELSMDRPEKPDVHQILNSPSYRLAELDTDFLQRTALRPVRVQLELLKPEVILAEQDVHSTIVAFGGTQIVEKEVAEQRLAAARRAAEESPEDEKLQRAVHRAESVLAKSPYYDAAREFSRIVSSKCQIDGHCDYVIVTGGGPGIMEAANRGAYDVGAKSMGLNITLPDEQAPNPYITPELCFQFHYFALRKMHFLFRAKALVVFPGGFGTLDELFDALTLRQTQRMQEIPIILYGREYWDQVINFPFLADQGVIRDEHLDLIDYAESPQEAWELIARFHGTDQSSDD